MARVVAPYAAVTAADALSCSLRRIVLDLAGSFVDIACAPTSFERCGDLAQTQSGTLAGGGSSTQHRQCITIAIPVAEIGERLQRSRVIFQQPRAQRTDLAGPGPDQTSGAPWLTP